MIYCYYNIIALLQIEESVEDGLELKVEGYVTGIAEDIEIMDKIQVSLYINTFIVTFTFTFIFTFTMITHSSLYVYYKIYDISGHTAVLWYTRSGHLHL